jgi:hypothetical protein
VVTLTGNFKYQDGSAVANGILTLQLSQPCTITATGQVAPTVQRVQLDASGAIPANTSVYGSDQLTPSGTVYAATLYAANKDASGAYVPADQLSNANWSLTGTSIDVSTLTPTGPNVSYPAVISSLVLPAEFGQSTSSGVVTISKATEAKNLVFAGPGSGADAAPTFRALVGADLPAPQAAVLGGVNSKASAAHNFLTAIGTDGSVSAAQPASTDLSDVSSLATLTGAQTLTNKILTGASAGNSVQLLTMIGNSGAITGNGAAQAVFSYVLPGNTMQAGKGIRIRAFMLQGGATNAAVMALNFGATNFSLGTFSAAGVLTGQYEILIFNKAGVTNAQIIAASGFPGTTAFNSTSTSSAVDTTGAVTITITFNVASSTSMTPILFVVEQIQ